MAMARRSPARHFTVIYAAIIEEQIADFPAPLASSAE